MKYSPGGYSWLAVAPESKEELSVEKIEDQIHTLKKRYEKKKSEKLLTQIANLEKKLKENKRP